MDSQSSDAVENASTPLPSDSSQSPRAGEAKTAASLKLPKIIPFDTLARCGEEIWIENNGEVYRLRRTKQGKLILTK